VALAKEVAGEEAKQHARQCPGDNIAQEVHAEQDSADSYRQCAEAEGELEFRES
jgi:hypothetical protein